jgi:putative transposase
VIRHFEQIEHWRRQYNTFRPHRSLGNLTPEEFAEKNKEEEILAQKLA